jgi:hypothetical protein
VLAATNHFLEGSAAKEAHKWSGFEQRQGKVTRLKGMHFLEG